VQIQVDADIHEKKETKERSYRVHTACFVHPRLRPRISVDSPRNLFRIFKRRDIFDFEHAAQGTQRQGWRFYCTARRRLMVYVASKPNDVVLL
jgi:hypothetical protein